MPQSMTGFARTGASREGVTLTWEIRSVNHRYLELKWSLPPAMSALENEMRAHLQTLVKRGKIDISATLMINNKVSIDVDETIVQAYFDLRNKLLSLPNSAIAPLGLKEILELPGVVVQKPSLQMGTDHAWVVGTFSDLMTKFVEASNIEGLALSHVLFERMNQIEAHLLEVIELIRELGPGLLKKCEAQVALLGEIDSSEKAHLIAQMLSKNDVEEECERLQMHIQASRALLQTTGQAVGRHLDFIIQEMLREVNTLGAKTATIKVTDNVILMKVLIEQAREQVQNVE